MEAHLKGRAYFQLDAGTGVTARIIRELTDAGSDPRGWFEPAMRGGWVYTRDYTYVTSEERDLIIQAMESDD